MFTLGSSCSTPHKAVMSRRSKESYGGILGNLDVWQTNAEVCHSHEKEGQLVCPLYGMLVP